VHLTAHGARSLRLAACAAAFALGCRGPEVAPRASAPAGPPGAAAARPVPTGPDHWRALGRAALERARRLAPEGPRARNAILFLGDGMSLETVVGARIFEGQQRGEPGEENQLAFETFPHVALVKTYNTDQQVPDSAGTMSAIVTGVKTRSGVLSMDEFVTPGEYAEDLDAHSVPTLLEQAEERGLSTGVVTTTTVTHATPAACYAHAPDRSWHYDGKLPREARRAGFPDIARQLVELRHGDGIEVALGGGRSFFLPEGVSDPEVPRARGYRKDGRDLTREWVERRPRSAYVWNRQQLAAIDASSTDRVLGLFALENMSFEFERSAHFPGEPSLSEMTAKAIEILARNPKGFFLMVEGGKIDHGHHDGSAYRAITDTVELANAVRTAFERVDPAETLVIVTADHGHTLSFGGNPTRGNPILGKVVENDDEGRPLPDLARDGTGVPYTSLSYANGPGYTGADARQPEGPKRWSGDGAYGQRGITEGPPDLTRVDTTTPDYLQAAAVPLANETHSGSDVPVYATGPGAPLFHGVQEQSYLYYAIAEALGWHPR
jgi:alkaline phosphatase